MMKKRKIISLMVLLLALLGVLVLVMALPDTGENGGFEKQPSSSLNLSEPIYSAKRETIDNIKIFYNGSNYSFKRNGDEWFCPEKTGVGISNSRVVNLVTELGSLRYQEMLDTSTVTPTDCGITDSSNFVTFTSELGQISLYLGNDVPDSELCYLSTSLSDDIYMVEKERVSLMFASFDEYRSDNFERIDFENIVEIEYNGPDSSFSLIKGEIDKSVADYYAWEMAFPVKLSVRDIEVEERFIKPLGVMNVSAYPSDNGDFSNYGIEKSKNSVTYTDASGKVQTIYFSLLKDNRHYLSIDADKTIYEVLPSSVPFAGVDLIDICERQIYLNKQTNIDTVIIKGDGIDYSIVFGDGSSFVNGKKLEKSSDIREVFSYICGLMADDISTKAIGKSEIKMTYNLKNGKEVVLDFASADERYYAVAKNGKPLYLIQKNKLKDLFDVLDGLKE